MHGWQGNTSFKLRVDGTQAEQGQSITAIAAAAAAHIASREQEQDPAELPFSIADLAPMGSPDPQMRRQVRSSSQQACLTGMPPVLLSLTLNVAPPD